VRRDERDARIELRQPIGARRNPRWVDIQALTSLVPLVEVHAHGNEDRDRLVERHAAAFGAARVEQRPER
jgi:hypothetical protein